MKLIDNIWREISYWAVKIDEIEYYMLNLMRLGLQFISCFLDCRKLKKSPPSLSYTVNVCVDQPYLYQTDHFLLI